MVAKLHPGAALQARERGGSRGLSLFFCSVPTLCPVPRRQNLKCRCQNAFLSLFLSKPKISSGSKPQQGKKRTFLLLEKKVLVCPALGLGIIPSF